MNRAIPLLPYGPSGSVIDLYGFMRASAALLAVNLQLHVRLFRPQLVEGKGTRLL
jgi:hypothetical protein